MAYAPRVICLWSQLAKVNRILFGSHAAVAVALLLPAWLLLCVVVPAVNHHTALHIVCGAPLRAHTTGDCGVFLSLLCLLGGCGPPFGHVTYSIAKGPSSFVCSFLCVLLSHTPKKNTATFGAACGYHVLCGGPCGSLCSCCCNGGVVWVVAAACSAAVRGGWGAGAGAGWTVERVSPGDPYG